MTKEEVFEKLVEVLCETFEFTPERIKPESRLNEELDIDSIDAVDLLVRMRPFMANKRLPPEVFKSVRTVQDVVDALYQLVSTPDATTAGVPRPEAS
jgi:acyl carrier protein